MLGSATTAAGPISSRARNARYRIILLVSDKDLASVATAVPPSGPISFRVSMASRRIETCASSTARTNASTAFGPRRFNCVTKLIASACDVLGMRSASNCWFTTRSFWFSFHSARDAFNRTVTSGSCLACMNAGTAGVAAVPCSPRAAAAAWRISAAGKEGKGSNSDTLTGSDA